MKEEQMDEKTIEIKDEDNEDREEHNVIETKTKQEEDKLQNRDEEGDKTAEENQNKGNIKQTQDESSLKYFLIISCVVVVEGAVLFRRKFI
jgi:hypothetical protein